MLQVAALGVFGYATFSIIAGCLGDYRKPPNLVVMVTGIISIVQVPWPMVNVIMNTITVVSVSLDGGNNVILPASMGSCCQLHLDTLLIQPCLWIIHQRSQKTKNLKMSCLVPLMNVRRGQISICILLKYWPTYGRASHLIWLQCPGYPAAAVYPRRGAEEDCECGPGQWSASAIQSHGRKNKE